MRHPRKISAETLRELVVLIRVLDHFPKGKTKLEKEWSKGVIFGAKYIVACLADISGKEKYKRLIGWDGEWEKLFGKSLYNKLKKSEGKIKK